MKLSNESRLEELMKFKKDFNEKLQTAYKIYEERSKTFGNRIKTKENNKENSSKNIKSQNNSRNLPKIKKFVKEKKSKIFKSPFSEDSDIDSIKIKKTGRSQLKLMSNTWKPQFMVCDYFETFKRLKDHYEMTNWEIVIIYLIYNIYYLIYRQE
jgi:hypothetical protein